MEFKIINPSRLSLITCKYCVVPENIPTHPMDGQWKFQGGGGWGVSKAKIFKESMKLKWNFQRGWGGRFKVENHPWGEVWIFSGTTHSIPIERTKCIVFRVRICNLNYDFFLSIIVMWCWSVYVCYLAFRNLFFVNSFLSNSMLITYHEIKRKDLPLVSLSSSWLELEKNTQCRTTCSEVTIAVWISYSNNNGM